MKLYSIGEAEFHSLLGTLMATGVLKRLTHATDKLRIFDMCTESCDILVGNMLVYKLIVDSISADEQARYRNAASAYWKDMVCSTGSLVSRFSVSVCSRTFCHWFVRAGLCLHSRCFSVKVHVRRARLA
jgi:hypothetical protein